MPPLPDVSNSAIAVWIAIAVMFFLAIGTITDKGLGPISRAWFEFAKRRREAAASREAADMVAVRRQLTNLLGLREADAERLNHMETFVNEVATWGFQVRQITSSEGITLPPFPEFHSELQD